MENTCPSMENIRIKLNTIARFHEQSKIAFQQLKSQIKIALLDAEEVFASLSIPLMRLVGVKTEEMHEEGRSTCILMNPCFPLHHKQGAAGPEDATRHRLLKAKVGCPDDNYASLAAKECRELEQKKRQQLQQLVLLLRQIETVVNAHHNTILEKLEDHQLSLRGLFQKATAYLSSIPRPDQPSDPTVIAPFKLLQATFKHVGLTLSSVEDDVEALVQAIAEKMCKPMASHVQGLVADTEGGLARRLVGLVEEMERAARERGDIAEAAGKRARKAEEAEAEAVKRLRKFEEKMRGMKELAGLFMEAKRRGIEASPSARKLLGAEKEESSNEQLLWDILGQKRQVGPTDLHPPQRKPSTTFYHAESQHERYLHGDEISTSKEEQLNEYKIIRRQAEATHPELFTDSGAGGPACQWGHHFRPLISW